MSNRAEMSDKACSIAAVAEMVTETTVEDFVQHVHEHDRSQIKGDTMDGPPEDRYEFTLKDLQRYLLQHDMSMGCCLTFKEGDGFTIHKQITLNTIAVLLVKEEDDFRVVVWSGVAVSDPKHEEPRLMEDYEVLAWWPVTRFM